ncbi:class C beta-lactamase-related serine hydrolase [Aurantiacibacter spongiae]|uniref:Class C beta-lactamase-related serine hydrolase n=2 Tax=Aurantiacibacter spongiae TaxID=2488860 RepID=A0A3N5CP03_9SPHN|nr:class C beta-lactamase-related serine hydrolase [Aurantiacibacter spongiae]
MIRPFTLATVVALSLAPSAAAWAQSLSQADLQTRYDRALAAGYKAMMLCSAIANAERNGTTRSPDSVIAWELAGIQEPLDDIVGELPFEIERGEGRGAQLRSVRVRWTDDMPPRIAAHDSQRGCSIEPIGWVPGPVTTVRQQREPAPLHVVAPRGSALSSALDRAFHSPATDGSPRTTAVLVTRGGEIIGERYAEGFDPRTPQRTWSVAKSIAATLIGAAVQRGEADVNSPAGLGSGYQDGLRGQITIDNALRMASGRYSDTPGNRTDPLYFGGSTVEEVALDWPVVDRPGSHFRYANNDTLAAVAAIADTFADHPPSALFAALGMDDTVAETDWQGNYVLSSQVWSTARDLAKLGQLYLDDGVTREGTRILPRGWVEYVSSPTGPQPGGDYGYGAGWWIMSGMAGIPDDAFAARGNRGQFIVVVPSRDVVIVRRGEDPAGGPGFDLEAFTRDVLATLAETDSD